jgi:hypothetical protein
MECRFQNMIEWKRNELGLNWTEEEAPGALPNGTKIVKVAADPDDMRPLGATGVVIGSLGPVNLPGWEHVKYGYFVRWDDAPEWPTAVMDFKVRAQD